MVRAVAYHLGLPSCFCRGMIAIPRMLQLPLRHRKEGEVVFRRRKAVF